MNLVEEEKRLLYIPLGIFIFMCLGTIYSWSIFRKPLETLFSVGATESGLPYMAFLASYAVVMPIAGSYIDKYGPKIVTMVGGVVVATGWILSGFASSILSLVITYGVIIGAGVGIIYGAPIAVVAKWFPEKQGFAVGLTLGGFGLSPFITAPLANWLIGKQGVLSTFIILGVIFGIIVTISAIPLKFPDKDRNETDSTNHKTNNLTAKEMLRTPEFYLLWFCFVLGTIIGLMAIGITAPVGSEVIGLSSRVAAWFVSFFAIFNGLGRPLFGWLSDKFGTKTVVIISYISIAFAATLMLLADEGNVVIYAISFTLFWLNLGGWLAIAPAATAEFFGPKHYSKNYGFLFTAYGVGAVIGTTLSGRLRDLFGSYIYGFYPVIALMLFGILVTIFFMKPSRVKNK